MSGLAVKVDLASAVRDAQRAFEEFGVDRFPRAVQYALTGVAIDAVNRFRGEIPNVWHAPNKATRDALRYTVDKDALGRIASVGEAKASVFVQALQSTWLKYSFGDGRQARPGGDVGIEAYFADQTRVAIPVNDNLHRAGLGSSGANGEPPARRVATLAAADYNLNTSDGTKSAGSCGVPRSSPAIRAGSTASTRALVSTPSALRCGGRWPEQDGQGGDG
ncbi:hypothetical protein [uncultured Methylobacterium sp.]|jgi:hypothetical protein|uniref:hypothetical protein n=1 Tax=uncultured Methylobacterium sp. TaxID=157278 RepID=UPI002632DCB4|nr:hypothetical protein [uncultured Methylobacterium sp.]